MNKERMRELADHLEQRVTDSEWNMEDYLSITNCGTVGPHIGLNLRHR